MKLFDRIRDPLKITGIYFGVAFLWILTSNYFVFSGIQASIDLVSVRMVEGGLFIVLSSVLIFVLMKRKITVIRGKITENQTYIQELHHRVRNNLSVIIALIELKSQELEGKPCQPLLDELRARTNSLATCQELLYQYKDPSAIPFHECIHRQLDSMGNRAQNGVQLQKKIEEVYLNINQAIPLSFIFSEIMLVNKRRLEENVHFNVQLIAMNGEGPRVALNSKITGISSASRLKSINESDILKDPITEAYANQLRGNWELTAGEDYLLVKFEFDKSVKTGSSAHQFI